MVHKDLVTFLKIIWSEYSLRTKEQMKLIFLTLSLLLVLHCELTSSATYTGTDAKDARKLLNAAQGVLSYGYSGTPGNARAYASSEEDSTGIKWTKYKKIYISTTLQ